MNKKTNIARGNTRECLDALIAKAEQRALLEPNLEKRHKHARLIRSLTVRLARAILREKAE